MLNSRRLLVFYDSKEAYCKQLYIIHGYPRAKFYQESLSNGINSVLFNVGNQIWSQLFIDHQQDIVSLSNIWGILYDIRFSMQGTNATCFPMEDETQAQNGS